MMGSSWPSVFHIATSVIDSGCFRLNSDPDVCEKLTCVLSSALKFMLKCKLPRRACEIVELTLTHARHLLSTEMLSTFAMGMRRSFQFPVVLNYNC
jgi:hypothetical protein